MTPKVLTSTLRALEREGLLTRSVYPTVPPRVEFDERAARVAEEAVAPVRQ
ncbi:winged helix-turn-helix transcriptional regulator [Streptomyces sp. NPDC047072]|uniref:winged helix-turn-helix transcriptional regulator n=1 Tax=Streptomyces sp. NPDC047072 TaxID=3154809 RepID=UPI0033DE3F76